MTEDGSTAWTPALLAVAPNGARKTKADHPALPMTPAELAEAALTCGDAGAAMIHLHVRDDEGAHSLDTGRYREAMAAIEAAVGNRMLVQVTTEAVGLYAPAEQMACVEALVPEAASVALRELVPDAESEAAAARFFAWAAEARVQLQYILYDAADVARFAALQGAGTIPAGAQFLLFVLGRYAAGQRSDPADLLAFLVAREQAGLTGCPWSVCAFGPKETAAAVTAAALGGHARVGFENNLYLPDGTTAPDNAASVAAAATGIRALGRGLADARVARRLTAPA